MSDVAPLLTAAPAGDRLCNSPWCITTRAAGTTTFGVEMPELTTAATTPLLGSTLCPTMTDVAPLAPSELDRIQTVDAGAVWAHTGGIDRPRAALISLCFFAAGLVAATGVVST